MFTEELINKRIRELDAQYELAVRQVAGLENAICELKKYAGYLIKTGDFSTYPNRMSGEAWRRRISEMIKELMKIDKKRYPSFNSVLSPIYIQLRNVYGVVLEQLRKDFRYKYDTLRYPTAFEAISEDDTVRSIFESLLLGMFPDEYFEDEVLEIIEGGGSVECETKPEEVILQILVPLAIQRRDNSFGYADTFNLVCNSMDCSWGNLQTRYMNKHNLEDAPSKTIILVENANVLRKFKKTVRVLLDESTGL